MNPLEEKLAALKQDFLQGLHGRYTELYSHWQLYLENKDIEFLDPLHRNLHSLAGSSGLYGCPEMGELARKVEIILYQFLNQKSEYSATDLPEVVSSGLSALKHAIDADGSVADNSQALDAVEDDSFLFMMGGMTEKKVRILIAEDDADTREYLRLVLTESGHDVVEAESGEQAIIQFLREEPDMILMDIIMPGMNGYEATKEIKSLACQKFVPVIFLTSITDDRMLARCIEAGGDDFLNKPFSRVIINSKIAAMQRIKTLHKDLEEYQALNEDEIRQAKHMFEAVLGRGGNLPVGVEFWGMAAGNFSGDTQLVYEIPGKRINVLLGDFTGHGLSPAVGTVLASEIFYRMAEQCSSPEEILTEINNSLNNVLPTGKYCAVGFIVVDLESEMLAFFNAGIPDMYCLGVDGNVSHIVASENMPLGIIKRREEDFELERMPLTEVKDIVMYTDGITEAENMDGEMYGEEALVKSFNADEGDSLIEKVKYALNAYTQGRDQLDDISIMTVDVSKLR